MKFESNQGLTSFDVMTLVASVVTVLVIVTPIVSKRFESGHKDMARKEAETLSLNLLADEKSSPNPADGRTPASSDTSSDDGVGVKTTGTDPWGQPYLYRYVRNSYGQLMYLVVMSPGPNKEVETPVSDIRPDEKGYLAVSFRGDDVGYVRPIR